MTKRIEKMGDVQGWQKWILMIRLHEASRQLLAIVLIAVFTIFGSPFEMVTLCIATALIAVGTFIRVWASGHVKKNKVLATDGPYAYVRHPLYVGNILVLTGFALASGLWWSFILLVAFLYAYYPVAIQYEDAKLHTLFGQEWENWSSKTRALLPSFNAKDAGAGKSTWSLKQSLMANGEPLIVIYVIYCVYVLFARLAH